MMGQPKGEIAGFPTVEAVDVTPELAETWLARNPNNRNLRKAVVDSYARDMQAGRWALNGGTLKLGLLRKLVTP